MRSFDQVDRIASSQEAIERFLCGEQYGTSTDISGETTHGYGILDDYGWYQIRNALQSRFDNDRLIDFSKFEFSYKLLRAMRYF